MLCRIIIVYFTLGRLCSNVVKLILILNCYSYITQGEIARNYIQVRKIITRERFRTSESYK